MPKHKLVFMPDAVEILKTSANLNVAAERMGLSTSTVMRAVRDGRLPGRGPEPRPAQGAVMAETGPDAGAEATTFEAWAQASFELSRADLELVRLAQQALDVAYDPEQAPALRLQASARYQALVKHLDFRVVSAAASRKVDRSTALAVVEDPRHMLRAAK